MGLKDIEPIAEKGFPRGLKTLVNDIADRVNRKIRIQFATDTLNNQARVEEDEDYINIILPRGLGAPGITDVIISFQGTLYYCDLTGRIKDPVPP